MDTERWKWPSHEELSASENIILNLMWVVWTFNENLVLAVHYCGQEIERAVGKLDLQQSAREKGCFIMKIIFCERRVGIGLVATHIRYHNLRLKYCGGELNSYVLRSNLLVSFLI